MKSKEECCARSMCVTYAVMYRDLCRGTDRRGRNERIDGLYGLIFRTVINYRGLKAGKGTGDLDSEMRDFVQWMKDNGRQVQDKHQLTRTFEHIQSDESKFEKNGCAYNPGTPEDSIRFPVLVGDEFQCFRYEDDAIVCPVEHGNPMGIVDFCRLFPNYFTEEAVSRIASRSLQPGTIWVRERDILDKVLNVVWLTRMIRFDDKERLVLDRPIESGQPIPSMNGDTISRVLIIFGNVGCLDTGIYNKKTGDEFSQLDANSLNNTYHFEREGMHIRHYRVFGDEPAPDGAEGKYGEDYKKRTREYRNSGTLSERVISDLLEDVGNTDKTGVKRTIVVLGLLYEKTVRTVKSSCGRHHITYISAGDLDNGDANAFFKECSSLFEKTEHLNHEPIPIL